MHIITGLLLAGLAGMKKNGAANDSVQVPRFTTGPVQTAHVLPGRLRLRVPSLKDNETGRQVVVERMSRIEGVESVAVTAVSGSVVIRYLEGLVEPALLFAALVRLLELDEEMEAARDPILTRELRNLGDSVNRAVHEKTGGLIDLWSSLMILLAGVGVRNMARDPTRAFPAGFSLVWWGLSSLRSRR